MQIHNPATGALLYEVAVDTSATIDQKLKAAQAAQRLWQQVEVRNRIEIIQRFGQLLLEDLDALALTLTRETGKPLQQSINEIKGAMNRIEYIDDNAESALQSQQIVASGATHESVRLEPLGVIANISAWNFPYNVGFNVFLYALVAGNAVMYKPSEFATLTGLAFAEKFKKAGLPDGLFQVIVGAGNVGQHLLEQSLNGYFFTGSYATGLHIAKEVAHKLVPVQLELGGKDPLYIADDIVDIKQAAINAAEGAFYNNGQSCCAVERIYVHDSIYEQFVEAFVAEVKSYKIGSPESLGTFIGPVTRQAQIEVLQSQVEDALAHGAKILLGGRQIASEGNYWEPTVLSEVNHQMKVMMEESFGPIIGIQKVKDDREAAELMADTAYGLTAAVFSAEEERALTILEQLNVGTIYWNCCDRVSPNVPWSGRGHSGLGSTLGSLGVAVFTQPKAYHRRKSQ